MAGIKSTQFSGRQIRSGAVDAEKIAPASVGQKELAEQAVTQDKVAPGAIGVEHLSREVVERLMPASTAERNYANALESSAEPPSGANPIATMKDVLGTKSFWGAPSQSVPVFSSDPGGSVKLARDSGVLFFKGDGGKSQPVAFDHSVGVNLEAHPEHRHLSRAEKNLIEAIVASGATASELATVAKAKSMNSLIVEHKDFIDVADGSEVLFVHDRLNDVDGERFVMILKNSDLPDLFGTTAKYFGHGAWFRNAKVTGTGRCDIDDRKIYVDGNRYMLESSSSLDRSVVGMSLQGSNSIVTDVDRDSEGRVFAEVSPVNADKKLPMILSAIETGRGTGWSGPRSLLTFQPKYTVSRARPVQAEIVSDGEGSYYVITLDSGGKLTCQRFHSSGEFATPVRLIPGSTTDLWPKTRFTSLSATCIIRESDSIAGQLDTRKIIMFLVDDEGRGWLLATGQLPRSTGSAGRTSNTVSFSLSEYVVNLSAWNNHTPRSHRIVVVGQGTETATAYAITMDDGVLVWTGINDTLLSASTASIISTSLQASSFKASSSEFSVEILARSYEGRQCWRHYALVQSGGVFGQLVSVSRTSDSEFLPPVDEHSISIACAQSYESGAWHHTVVKMWSVNGVPYITTQRLNSTGTTITNEFETQSQGFTLDDLDLIGSTHCYLFSRSDNEATGLSMRRILISANDAPYIDDARQMSGVEMLSRWISPIRVIYNDDGIALVRSQTRQSEPLFTASGVYPNDHDFALLSWNGSSVVLHEARPPVRLRSIIDENPPSALLASLATQLSSVQSMTIGNPLKDVSDVEIESVEGAIGSSMRHPSGIEWVFLTGGVKTSDRETVAESRLIAVRNILGGSPAMPSYAIKSFDMPGMLPRAYHGQWIIGNASSLPAPAVSGSSAFIFLFGGRKEGGVDKDAVGAMAAPILSRIYVTNLNDSTSNMTNVDATYNQTIDLSAALPQMLNPTVFGAFDGTLWRLVIVDAPSVWVLKESTPNSLFGSSMPDVTNVYSVGPDLQASILSRNACAVFQEVFNAPGNFGWNQDIQTTRPGKTTVICFTGDDGSGSGAELKAMEFDPNNENNITWHDVIVDSNERPAPRIDGALVWSGIKYSNRSEDRHVLWLYGGNINGIPSSDVWMLEYWKDSIGTHKGTWIRITDTDHFSLLPACSSPVSVRRPVPTQKNSASDLSVYLGLGRLRSGVANPALFMVQPPMQMKTTPDVPLEGYARDMGGTIIPSRCWVVAEPIDIHNVDKIAGNVDIECFESFGAEITYGVRVAIGMDGTDELYTCKSAGWSTVPFSLDDMESEAGTLAELINGLGGAYPIERGATPFFTSIVEKMYIVFLIPAMDPNDEIKLKSVKFQATLQDLSSGEITWGQADTSEYKIALTSSRAVMVYNTSGSTIERLRVVVAGRNSIDQ